MARPHARHALYAMAPLIAAFLASSALAEPEPKPKPKPDDGVVAQAGLAQAQASTPADGATQGSTQIIGVLRGADMKAKSAKAAQHPGGSNLASATAPMAAAAPLAGPPKPLETPPPK